jgi:uncharacterized membrane-anchored protein
MRFVSRNPAALGSGVTGTLRGDRRLGTALRRAGPGDIVVIDEVDLDRTQAEALLRREVGAVVNASPFITGRYPNLGPEILAEAGVVLLDEVGPGVFVGLPDGSDARVDGDTLVVRDRVLAAGTELSLADVRRRMDQARSGLSAQLSSLASNAAEHLRREEDLLLHGVGLPALRTAMAGRPVVVIARDFDHEADLRRLRAFLREQRPVLVGVDAGADVLLAARLRPDLVVVGRRGLTGDPRTRAEPVSDRALRAAGEVLVHDDGGAQTGGRLDRLGVTAARLSASGPTEDLALLVADTAGAALIVTVGAHASLDELLDRHRDGLGATVLTRLRVGPRLVDARSVPVLYAGRVRAWHLWAVLLAGVLAVLAAVSLTPAGSELFEDVLLPAFQNLADRARGLMS